MKRFFIEGTDQSPKVILDKKRGIFELSGNALPEDVNEFYKPIFDWFDEYIQDPNPKTKVKFNFFYFNSSSSKMIFEILKKLQFLYEQGKEVEVVWYYSEEDEEMDLSGHEFSEHFKYPFRIISVS